MRLVKPKIIGMYMARRGGENDTRKCTSVRAQFDSENMSGMIGQYMIMRS
jgi:hypothetical protein